jgi:hypothetical protein
MTEGGTIQRPELRARGWSRKMRRQFLPYQPGEVDAHVFDLVTVVQAEGLPEWQAKKMPRDPPQKAAKRALRRAYRLRRPFNVRELKPEISTRHTVILFGDRDGERPACASSCSTAEVVSWNNSTTPLSVPGAYTRPRQRMLRPAAHGSTTGSWLADRWPPLPRLPLRTRPRHRWLADALHPVGKRQDQDVASAMAYPPSDRAWGAIDTRGCRADISGST